MLEPINRNVHHWYASTCADDAVGLRDARAYRAEEIVKRVRGNRKTGGVSQQAVHACSRRCMDACIQQLVRAAGGASMQ